MDSLQVGFGAYKLSTIISKEMNSQRDSIQQKTKINIPEQRKSIKEKLKFQFQNAKKKLIEKLHDPNEKQTLTARLEEQDQEIQPDQSMDFLELKKQQQEEFVLAISSSSTSSSDSEYASNDYYEQSKKLILDDEIIKQNGMYSTLTNPQLSIGSKHNFSLFMHSKRSEQQIGKSKMKNQQFVKPQIVKKNIDFLRGLQQNENFINNEQATLLEYKINKEIFIEMDCQDITTFMRLQHEVEEMKRKQDDFNQQKNRHYKIVKKQNPDELNKTHSDSKFWTILMAKRFVKNIKVNKEIQINLQARNNFNSYQTSHHQIKQ